MRNNIEYGIRTDNLSIWRTLVVPSSYARLNPSVSKSRNDRFDSTANSGFSYFCSRT